MPVPCGALTVRARSVAADNSNLPPYARKITRGRISRPAAATREMPAIQQALWEQLLTFSQGGAVVSLRERHSAQDTTWESERDALSRRELLELSFLWFALSFHFAALLPIVIPAQILQFVTP